MGNWRPGLGSEFPSGIGKFALLWIMGVDGQDWMLHFHHVFRGLHPSKFGGLEVSCKIHFSMMHREP